MKKTAVTLLMLVVVIVTSVPAFGGDNDLNATFDVLVVRPVSLAATVIGTAVFIVSLPFSIPSSSVGSTARTLVSDPFNYTFTRPIGNFSESWDQTSAPPTEQPMEKDQPEDSRNDQ